MRHTPIQDGRGDSAALNPYAHFTLCEDGSMIVFAGGMPLCNPTTFERARSVAIEMGLGGHLPIFDAARGTFGVQWPSKEAA
jgi:hypothetical protein